MYTVEGGVKVTEKKSKKCRINPEIGKAGLEGAVIAIAALGIVAIMLAFLDGIGYALSHTGIFVPAIRNVGTPTAYYIATGIEFMVILISVVGVLVILRNTEIRKLMSKVVVCSYDQIDTQKESK